MIFKTGDSRILKIYIYVGKVLKLPSPGAIEILSLGLPNSISPTWFLAKIGSVVLTTITKLL